MRSHPAVRLGALALVWVPLAAGCVTVAEFRKLERDVIDLKRGGGAAGASGERVAEMSAQVESLEQQLARLEGRLEVTEHNVEAAMREANRNAGRNVEHRGARGLYRHLAGRLSHVEGSA